MRAQRTRNPLVISQALLVGLLKLMTVRCSLEFDQGWLTEKGSEMTERDSDLGRHDHESARVQDSSKCLTRTSLHRIHTR